MKKERSLIAANNLFCRRMHLPIDGSMPLGCRCRGRRCQPAKLSRLWQELSKVQDEQAEQCTQGNGLDPGCCGRDPVGRFNDLRFHGH